MIPDLATPCNAGGAAPRELPSPTVDEVLGWLRLLAEPGQLVELRAIRHDKKVEAGYFEYERLDVLAQWGLELSASGRFKGVYVTFNPLAPQLLSRSPNRVTAGIPTAKDADVVRRRWLLIDVDPQRPGTVSATDAEKQKAEQLALQVRGYLRGLRWPEPVLADSGNGYHLLYRIDLPVDDGGLVKRLLNALADKFPSDHAEIDRKVFNPSRITKLYGSRACKGEHTAERPHRHSRIIEVPERVEAVPLELLDSLAGPAEAVTSSAASGPSPGDETLGRPAACPWRPGSPRPVRTWRRSSRPSRAGEATPRPSVRPACW